MIGPAPVLAILVGIFHTSLFILIRGSTGGQLPLLVVAAVLGAWAGDALGARLGFDLLRIGDFRLVAASLVAWVGVGFVSVVSILGPTRRKAGS
ncbi:MAG TPA: hypothetical protein VGQ64_01120 [Candidatus Limnocylindrales bacterium]|jgi:hypothetical protein|nr:hypothetical protein [Candidatus Limnocylindrales bacterium]